MGDKDDVTFFDLFGDKPKADKDLIESRLAICIECPAFRKSTQQCKKCGCFMKLKTTLIQAKCPIGKW